MSDRKPDKPVVQPTNTNDWYYPSDSIVANSHVPDYEAVYAAAKQDPLAFWAERANELEWYKTWDTVLDESNAPPHGLPAIVRIQYH